MEIEQRLKYGKKYRIGDRCVLKGEEYRNTGLGEHLGKYCIVLANNISAYKVSVEDEEFWVFESNLEPCLIDKIEAVLE